MKRSDIINKALLRSIKRFIIKEFKKDNKRLVKKRFRQAKAIDILAGFVKTWNRLLPNIPNIDSIAQFAMILSGIRSSDTYPHEESLKNKADHVVHVIYHYTASQFEQIFKIKELEVIVKFIFENSPEDLYKPHRDKYQTKKELCVRTINAWMGKFAKF